MNQMDMRYNRAMQIINYLLEGEHNMKDVREEFKISKYVCKKDFEIFLFAYGVPTLIQRNKILYEVAMRKVQKENISRRNKIRAGE